MILEQIGSSASIISLLAGGANWIRQRLTQGGIRIETAVEQGPITRQSGFTEPAVKITVVNEGAHPVKIRDVRLMLCRDYGAPVAAEAPPERFHAELPFDLQPGTDESWYVPAENYPTCFMPYIGFDNDRLPVKDGYTPRKMHRWCGQGLQELPLPVFGGSECVFPFLTIRRELWARAVTGKTAGASSPASFATVMRITRALGMQLRIAV